MGNASFIHRRMCVVLRALIDPGVRYIKTKMNQADELSELPKGTNQGSSIQGRAALAAWACYPSAQFRQRPHRHHPRPYHQRILIDVEVGGVQAALRTGLGGVAGA